MSLSILPQSEAKSNTLAVIGQHEPTPSKFYRLTDGWDCEIECLCSQVFFGHGHTTMAAEAEALSQHREHLRIVYEHSRCPQNGWEVAP